MTREKELRLHPPAVCLVPSNEEMHPQASQTQHPGNGTGAHPSPPAVQAHTSTRSECTSIGHHCRQGDREQLQADEYGCLVTHASVCSADARTLCIREQRE